MFGLERPAALQEARAVVQVVALWKEHFAALGVTARDIELLAEQIDRPFLAEQRQAVLAQTV
jgi:serine/threonine-protein kinase HipA